MYQKVINASLVTAIIPERYIEATLQELKSKGHDVIWWHGRGTLQDTRWYKKFFPVLRPEKAIIRVLAANSDVDQIIENIIDKGHLHRHGSGAVYSMPCNDLHIGGHFKSSCANQDETEIVISGSVKEDLDVIHCIVAKEFSEKISDAAIDAGAHGPVIYYSEGRGLRDRLGWLRITKQTEKELLTVIVDNSNADNIFNAMANAGHLDLPGHGYMYQMPIHKGLFNLPSHFDANHHAANMQQIISALDQLVGDEHWRDQTVFEMSGAGGKSAGINFLNKGHDKKIIEQQICLTAMVDREHSETIINFMLNSGAPGLNTNYCQYITSQDQEIHEGVTLVSEYCIINCIVSDEEAHKILEDVKENTAKIGIDDVCLFLQPVPKAITYIHPAHKDKRRQ